jgi:hypothetical protein
VSISDRAGTVQSLDYGLSSPYIYYGWRLTGRPNVADAGANGSGAGDSGIIMRVIILVRAYLFYANPLRTDGVLMVEWTGLGRHARLHIEPSVVH